MKKFVLRLSTLAVMMMAVLSGVSLFWVSQEVQQLERKQRVIRQQVSGEEEGIRVLSAEWDYLNRPERLEALANRYLGAMGPVEPENLLRSASAVPEKQEFQDEDNAIVQVVQPVAKPQNIRKIPEDVPAASINDKKSGSTDDFSDVLGQIEGEKE